MSWENRITKSGTANPKDLIANPKNWRKHPKAQEAALKDVLAEVGWVQDVIVNETTGNLVDGHLRVEVALKNGEAEIPVKYVALTEEEEALILMTLDPIGALAVADKKALDALLDSITVESEAVMKMIEDIETREAGPVADADEGPVEFAPVPEEEASRLDQKRTVVCPECGHEFTP